MSDLVLRPLGAADSGRVRRYLAQEPERDVYLCGLVWRLGVILPAAAGELLGSFRGTELTGVFLNSTVAVLSSDDAEAIDAFAELLADAMPEAPLQQVISPEPMVAALVDGLARERMPTLRLHRMDLVSPSHGSAPVRNAGDSEEELVREACRAVTVEELAIDPLALDPSGFQSALRRRIRTGREYVWIDSGELRFRAALSAATPEAALIEGVYVPPPLRGRGYGTAGTHGLCERLLRFHRRMVLFVGAENGTALRLYQRLGFRRFAEYRAIYFEGA